MQRIVTLSWTARCAGDAEFRARVEALLKANDAAPLPSEPSEGDWNSTSGYTPEDFKPGANREAVSSRIGTVVAGKYRLIEVIGEGGMGSVYLASQTEPVKRQVALEADQDGHGLEGGAGPVRRRAAGTGADGPSRTSPASTTAASPRPASRSSSWSWSRACRSPTTATSSGCRSSARLELFVAVCQAVQHAHQKGIIHRDLKPGNVLVTEVDGRPTPKVIDFGVAKATEQKLTDMSFAGHRGDRRHPGVHVARSRPTRRRWTSTPAPTSTPSGVMLYELLDRLAADRRASSSSGAAILEMLRMVREVEPPRPSTKLSTADALPNIAANRSIEPAKLAKLLRGELDWVVMKALEKDRTPALRHGQRPWPATSSAIWPTRWSRPGPPSAGYRLKKFVTRNKGQVIAASLVFLTLVGGIVGTTLGLLEARQQEEIARGETAEKEKARLAEAKRVEERDEALKKEAQRIVERDKALKAEGERSDELRYRLGVSEMVLAAAAYENRDAELANERLDRIPEGAAAGNGGI